MGEVLYFSVPDKGIDPEYLVFDSDIENFNTELKKLVFWNEDDYELGYMDRCFQLDQIHDNLLYLNETNEREQKYLLFCLSKLLLESRFVYANFHKLNISYENSWKKYIDELAKIYTRQRDNLSEEVNKSISNRFGLLFYYVGDCEQGDLYFSDFNEGYNEFGAESEKLDIQDQYLITHRIYYYITNFITSELQFLYFQSLSGFYDLKNINSELNDKKHKLKLSQRHIIQIIKFIINSSEINNLRNILTGRDEQKFNELLGDIENEINNMNDLDELLMTFNELINFASNRVNKNDKKGLILSLGPIYSFLYARKLIKQINYSIEKYDYEEDSSTSSYSKDEKEILDYGEYKLNFQGLESIEIKCLKNIYNQILGVDEGYGSIINNIGEDKQRFINTLIDVLSNTIPGSPDYFTIVEIFNELDKQGYISIEDKFLIINRCLDNNDIFYSRLHNHRVARIVGEIYDILYEFLNTKKSFVIDNKVDDLIGILKGNFNKSSSNANSNFNELRYFIINTFKEDLKRSASIHDLGKIGIDPLVISHTGRLSEKAKKEFRDHTTKGIELFMELFREMFDEQYLEECRRIIKKEQPQKVIEMLIEGLGERRLDEIKETVIKTIYYHHERPDGAGYPVSLPDQYIPYAGKITTVADVIDAILGKRLYSEKNKTIDQVLDELWEERGNQVDYNIIYILLQGENRKYFKQFLEELYF